MNVGAFALIYNELGEVLISLRNDFNLWNLPGGGVEAGESPWQGVIREVKEETGLDVEIVRLTGVYKKMDKDEIVFSFICSIVGGDLNFTSEAREHRYVAIADIPENFSPNQKERIIDALGDGVALKYQSQSVITKELRQNIMIDKNFTYAIVGASDNEEKYGHIVLKDLYDSGYKVIPINPKGGEIFGLPVFKSITEVPEKIDVAIMIVPPPVGLEVLSQIKDAGIKSVWFQPGSESDEQMKYCRENGIQYVTGACMMQKKR